MKKLLLLITYFSTPAFCQNLIINNLSIPIPEGFTAPGEPLQMEDTLIYILSKKDKDSDQSLLQIVVIETDEESDLNKTIENNLRDTDHFGAVLLSFQRTHSEFTTKPTETTKFKGRNLHKVSFQGKSDDNWNYGDIYSLFWGSHRYLFCLMVHKNQESIDFKSVSQSIAGIQEHK